MNPRESSTPGYDATPSPRRDTDTPPSAFATEISVQDARTLDALATDEFGVPPTLLMEHAAIALRDAATQMLASATTCWVVAGPGNNGGDGIALTRLLHNDGLTVRLFHMDPARELSSDHVRAYAAAVRKLGVTIEPLSALDPSNAPALVVDALLGTGIHGPPHSTSADAIHAINTARDKGAKVLSCDVPSGLSAQTGEAFDPCVSADRTVTFVAPKPGLARMDAQKHVGELTVAPIGVPRALIERFVGRVEPASRGGP